MAWAEIEASLQCRADLIPNLVATVKGNAQHEQEPLQKVIEARANAKSYVSQPDHGKIRRPVTAYEAVTEKGKKCLALFILWLILIAGRRTQETAVRIAVSWVRHKSP